MRFLFLLIGLAAVAPSPAASLDSLLASQRERAGALAASLFTPLDHPDRSGLTADEADDYRFLLANIPLGDLALMSSDDLLENVRLARQAREYFSWGSTYDDDLYRHFVLPHRISQEPFVKWREQFIDKITPRVEALSMKEALLEVNHWCHERATYRPTDGRDQDPLTTIRSGFGRCEEEMILTIAALRSVGIPARQCYTPYWAHSDDNHAWVEAWADGKWWYLGACEPAQDLNQAWFSGPAARAMLVVSSAYGDYNGDEPVLRRYGRSTNVNSTAVYGPTKKIAVTVVNRKARPVAGVKVIFSLWNCGALMPATSVMTDKEGMAKLTCGLGDWFVGAAKDDWMGFAYVKGNEREVKLKLDSTEPTAWPTACDYEPPVKPETKAPDVISAEGEARGITHLASEGGKALTDSLFGCRMQGEDSVREARVWFRWPGLPKWLSNPVDTRDTSLIGSSPSSDLLRKARGNWTIIYSFLDTTQRRHESGFHSDDVAWHVRGSRDGTDQLKPEFIQTLSEKDLRDFGDALDDHYRYNSIPHDLTNRSTVEFWTNLDTVSQARFRDYVIAPRIDNEPSLPWRKELIDFLQANPKLLESTGDKKLLKWIRKEIALADNPDRLGPPLTPAQTLRLRRGTEGDIERLYVGLCRVRGRPARFNPVSGQLERWDQSGWVTVPVLKPKKGKKPPAAGRLTVEIASADTIAAEALYLKDWAVSKWSGGHGEVTDLGWHQPFKAVTWPQELPGGSYLLTSGVRREDGSAPVKLVWFEIRPGKETKVSLEFR